MTEQQKAFEEWQKATRNLFEVLEQDYNEETPNITRSTIKKCLSAMLIESLKHDDFYLEDGQVRELTLTLNDDTVITVEEFINLIVGAGDFGQSPTSNLVNELTK